MKAKGLYFLQNALVNLYSDAFGLHVMLVTTVQE